MKIYSEKTNIGLRHLRAIHVIWQQGSFTRAADILGVVPSALSETVRQIEEHAGAPLFSRSGRPILPTPLGLAFLQDTAPLLGTLGNAFDRLRRQGHLLEGALAVGASPSAISGLVAPVIAAFHKDHPEITLTLHDDIAETLAAAVIRGDLDLALAGRTRESQDLEQVLVKRDPFILACRTDSALFRRGSIPLAEIDPEGLIHLDPKTGISELIAATPELGERYRTGPLRAHSTVAQLCLVRAGLGLALIPMEAMRLFNDPMIGHVSISGLALERSLYLLLPRHRARSHVALLFETYVRAAIWPSAGGSLQQPRAALPERRP